MQITTFHPLCGRQIFESLANWLKLSGEKTPIQQFPYFVRLFQI